MEFRIGTWNCFGMGQSLVDAVTARRAPHGERLSHDDVLSACAAPHVLCVQELLSTDAQRFFDSLASRGFASTLRDDNRLCFRSATARGSGLGIGSRWAPIRYGLRHFPKSTVGWDRLARKGALYAQLSLEHGPRLDVLTVHLQAGVGAAAERARAEQLVDLAAFIEQLHSKDRPFIICGDFNICGLAASRGSVEYRRLREALPGFTDLGEGDDLVTYDPHEERNALARSIDPTGQPQRIDYIFYRGATDCRHRLECSSLDLMLHEPLSSRQGPGSFASDHFGLAAAFEYRAEE